MGSEVVNGTTPTPGPHEAVGFFYIGIDAPEDTICWVGCSSRKAVWAGTDGP